VGVLCVCVRFACALCVLCVCVCERESECFVRCVWCVLCVLCVCERAFACGVIDAKRQCAVEVMWWLVWCDVV
jgi:hypothetical protein